MPIKLIYGNNGNGKSRYSKEVDKNSFIVLNSSISNWYDEEQKIISELNYLMKPLKEKIDSLTTNLISANSSLKDVKGFKVGTFKVFLKNINFSTKEEWDQHTSIESDYVDISIPDLIDWSTFITEHKDILEKIEVENQELLLLFSSFKHENSEHKYKTDNAKKLNLEAIDIISSIKDILDKSNIKTGDFEKIKFKDLKRIFSGIDKIPELTENLNNAIKNKIIISKEYLDIKTLEKEMEELKKTSIKFIEGDAYELMDDGYSIKIDLGAENYSEGQKAAKILKILVNSLENTNKKIILDDFFEKLDSTNQEFAINSIINSTTEFEILTHDTKTVEIIQSESRQSNIKISENKISINEKGVPEIKGANLSLSFANLCYRVWNSDEEKHNSSLNIFIKMFGRYTAQAGSFTGDNLTNFKENKNSKSWKFSSNNVFHYNSKINFKEIKEIFLLDVAKNVNSIEMLEILKDKIKKDLVQPIKFGISYKKILEYINEVINCLSEEKMYFDYMEENNLNDKETSLKLNKYYENFWKGKEKVKPQNVTKVDRGKIMHKLENSLLIIADL